MKRLILFFPLALLPLFGQKDYFDRQNVLHFEFNFGVHEPDTDSDYFDVAERDLTFDRDDLDGNTFFFRLHYQLSNKLSVGGGIAHYEETVNSEDRFFVDENGFPIFQSNSLETTWAGVQLLWTPFGAGETFGTKGWAPKFFVPYLTLGLGFKNWELLAEGEFVDVVDEVIFAAEFFNDGTVFSPRIGCGFRLNLHKNIDLNFSYERDYGEDDLSGDFSGFGDFDLSSKSATIGIILRI